LLSAARLSELCFHFFYVINCSQHQYNVHQCTLILRKQFRMSADIQFLVNRLMCYIICLLIAIYTYRLVYNGLLRAGSHSSRSAQLLLPHGLEALPMPTPIALVTSPTESPAPSLTPSQNSLSSPTPNVVCKCPSCAAYSDAPRLNSCLRMPSTSHNWIHTVLHPSRGVVVCSTDAVLSFSALEQRV
jgi:hypothetical protein